MLKKLWIGWRSWSSNWVFWSSQGDVDGSKVSVSAAQRHLRMMLMGRRSACQLHSVISGWWQWVEGQCVIGKICECGQLGDFPNSVSVVFQITEKSVVHMYERVMQWAFHCVEPWPTWIQSINYPFWLSLSLSEDKVLIIRFDLHLHLVKTKY